MAKKLLTTPRGVFVFPRLSGEPDTKFDEAGVWKVTLRLNAEAGAPLMASIDEALEKSYNDTVAEFKKDPKKKNKKVKKADAPYKVDEETGDIEVTFKMKASGISKKTEKPWSRKPRLFNAKGEDITNTEPKVGGGSEGKVSYELSTFFTDLVGAGVSLRLEAVKILKLVEFGGGTAEQYGFGGDESDEDTEETGGFPEETPAEEGATSSEATDF